MAYPIEALLRRAYELRASCVSALGAGVVLVAPGLFLLSRPWDWLLAGALMGHTAWRGAAGLRTLRYRVNLRRQRHYAVASTEIPWSAERLFLGRGFQWDQRHTQRLLEARRPENQTLLHQGLLVGLFAKLRPPVAAPAGLGGDPAIHGVGVNETDIWMDIADRVGHTLVLGTTRVGKTRLAELLITQDIRRGEVVIVFDPKGDIDLLRRIYAEAERAGRLGEFFMFHLGHPEISARYNPVGSFSRITEGARVSQASCHRRGSPPPSRSLSGASSTSWRVRLWLWVASPTTRRSTGTPPTSSRCWSTTLSTGSTASRLRPAARVRQFERKNLARLQ